MKRSMVFKMERDGLLKQGDVVPVSEGVLPVCYYYVIEPALAMSGNIPFGERLLSRTGRVTDIARNERGYYVTVEFSDEETAG